MTTERNESCADRIAEHMASRIDDIRNLWNEPHSNEDGYAYKDGYEALNEYGLSFEYRTGADGDPAYFIWLLSTGGPHEEFRFYVNPDYTLYKIEFAFLDWYDGATSPVYDFRTKDKPESDYNLLKEIWHEFFCVGGETEHLQNMVKEAGTE